MSEKFNKAKILIENNKKKDALDDLKPLSTKKISHLFSFSIKLNYRK